MAVELMVVWVEDGLAHGDLVLVLLGGGAALGVLVHPVAVRRQTVASLDTVEDPAVRHAGNLPLLGVAVLVCSRTGADLTIVMVDLTEKYERGKTYQDGGFLHVEDPP